MRTLGLFVISLALFACASSSAAPPTATPPEGDPPSQPAEVEGPAPATESASVASEEGLCALGPLGEWAACDGQRVQLRGTMSEHVSQHPMLSGPDEEQGYVDAEGTQLIVLTKTPIACDGAVSVVGTLRGIDLGGEPGTKNSYGGWAIESATVTCE